MTNETKTAMQLPKLSKAELDILMGTNPEEYQKASERPPYCQWLQQIKAKVVENGEESEKVTKGGIFIPTSEAAKVYLEFSDYVVNKHTSHTYNSGRTEEGFLFKSPRMVVKPQTEYLAFRFNEKEKKHEIHPTNPVYNKDIHSGTGYGCHQYIFVLLLDHKGNFLHQIPLRMRLKGAALVTFGQHHKKFCNEMYRIYGGIINAHRQKEGQKALKIPQQDVELNPSFTTRCIFEPLTAIESVEGWSASALKVNGYTKPNTKNFKDLFLALNQEACRIIDKALEPEAPLLSGLPSEEEQPALPASQATETHESEVITPEVMTEELESTSIPF